MGYSNYSEVALENRMAKTSENVYNLLDQIWTPAVAKAKEEIADIKAEIKKDGFNFEPEGWDYMYYSDRAKKAKYNINEEEVSEYLEINNVLKGIFYVANLFIQAGVNTFDTVMVAGNSAAANSDGLVYDVMAAFYTACTSFMAQNT